MYKIGAVGERDALMAFLAIGISIKAVENAEDAKNAVNKMADDGYGLIFITENTAKDIKDTIDKYKNKLVPAIILIPGTQGSLGIGLQNIKENVAKAIGVDILSKKEG